MISFNLFNILHVNVTIIYILWISVFSSSVPGYAGLARLAGLTVLGRTRTANPLLTGSGFFGIGLEIGDDSPGQPAHETACQQDLDSQQVPRRR